MTMKTSRKDGGGAAWHDGSSVAVGGTADPGGAEYGTGCR